MSDELMDRFGNLPQPVQNLLAIADLKAAAHAASITEIKERPREIALSVLAEPTFDRAEVPRIIGSFGGMFGVRNYPTGTVFVYNGERGTRQMIANLKRFTSELARTAQSGYNEQ
jgi:transcription-repair coupling factor (superfamily II helicase)